MSIETLTDITSRLLEQENANWSWPSLRQLGSTQLPDAIFLGNRLFLEADAKVLWIEWFIDSIIDRRRADLINKSYAHIYKEVRECVDRLFGDADASARRNASRNIAEVVRNEVARRRKSHRRNLSFTEKRALLGEQTGAPRCRICGFEFSSFAVDLFLGLKENTAKIERPRYVDIAKPIGNKWRDLYIEVDHIDPISRGGGTDDNLQLVCGWCNRSKSDYRSLYDVGADTRRVDGRSVPNPFWVVRMIALRGRCEVAEGCDSNVENSELTVAKRIDGGVFSPPNMYVICHEHDPWSEFRWYPVG